MEASEKKLFRPQAITFESFEDEVAAAGAWIRESGVRVVQLETVVLPNIWSPNEQGSTDAAIGIGGGMSVAWHQFIRVWYEIETPPTYR